MTILVTGGAGFIGSHVVRRLRDQGELVFVLDNYSRVIDIPQDSVAYNITNQADVISAFVAADGVEEVIHLAYINGTKSFYERPFEVMDVALRGMLNVLFACKMFAVKKFTLVSSSEVCRAKLVDTEENIPLVIPDPYNPRYSYSAGKIMSEMLALHCGYFDRLLIARPFNIYGPGMTGGHVIPDLIDQAKLKVTPFQILGHGEETRSFCYIDDFIDGFMLMREKGEHKGIYNIGTDDEITIRNLAIKILETTGAMFRTVKSNGQLREGDAVRRRPDISKLRALGYEPKINLEEGLRRIIG